MRVSLALYGAALCLGRRDVAARRGDGVHEAS